MTRLSRQRLITLDKHNLLGSIEHLPDQISQSWTESRRVHIPAAFRSVSSIVVCGMGGSSWPGQMLAAIFADRLRVPMVFVNDYALPAHVGPKSLVVLSSYSGGTEETLAAARQAIGRRARIIVVTSGGKLASLKQAKRWPGYLFTPTWNVSNQPRMGIGYTFIGLAGLLTRAGLLQLNDSDIRQAVQLTRRLTRQFAPAKAGNPAWRLAGSLVKAIPVIVSSQHLTGAARGFTYQLNENAKHFAVRFSLPELNHHLLEGLAQPPATRHLHFVLIESGLYHARNQRRYAITKQVIVRCKLTASTFRPRSATPFLQAIETYHFGSYVSFYLAMLHGIDPSAIPWVDYFKAALAKR